MPLMANLACKHIDWMKHRMPTLDLFSGIGGFSLALRDVCKTVAYCEIDETCQRILRSCMERNHLDIAPIHNDVRTLDPTGIRPSPRLITAGFPCTDVSSANPFGSGIAGLKSGLVNEVFRIVDACDTVVGVFLENSSFIRTRGIDHVLQAFEQRNFRVRMMELSARDIGALHRRTRWWCLATKNTRAKFSLSRQVLAVNWAQEPCKRVCKRNKSSYTECNKTNKAYGNAIVPACAQAAYNCLLGGKDIAPVCVPSLSLILTDGVNTIQRTSWPTPTAQKWNQYRYLSDRSTRVLSNAIFYEEKTIQQTDAMSVSRRPYMDKEYVINPSFVAWLMGYPISWHGTLCCR